MQGTDAPRHWLIFKNSAFEATNALIQNISASAVVTVVVPGKQFSRLSSNAYVMDTGNPEHYASLFEDLRENDSWPTHILYTARGCELTDAPQEGFQQLFHLGQALQHAAEAGSAEKLALFVFTDKAFDVLQVGRCNPANTAVACLADIMGLELRGLTTRTIDCDFEASGSLAPMLAQELASGGEQPLVAYRGRTRWVPSWVSLPTSPVPAGSPKALKLGGTYIVVGGTGGIGLILTQYLARAVSAHVVLVSRSAFAPASEWGRIANDEDASASDRNKARALLAIQLLGGSVEVLAADISNRERMREVVASARQRNGRISGIVHAAGITGNSLIGVNVARCNRSDLCGEG